MGRLTLRLLGPPEVLHEGRPARFRARKALALLAYLAAEGGTRSRADITALLWPRSDEDRGRAALRSALSSLRRTLETEPHHYLRTDRGSLGLAFGPDLELDLQVLQAAYGLARSNPRSDDLGDEARPEVLAKLRAGAEAYRGDFLEGFSLEDAPEFDLWVEAEREVWRGRVGLVYDHLCKLLLEGGDARDAIVTAARWLEHAPAIEEAHRRLMEAQFAAGDRSGALNTYEALRSILARELGTEPATETEALISRTGERAAVRPVTPPASRPATPKQELPGTTPFVGRAEEFGVLLEGYNDALCGEARAVAFVGDAGIGKTRLAEEFLLWVRERGAEVLSGRTYEVEGRLPYGVVIDALRPRLERERSPDDLLEDVWLSELSRVLPELRERYPDLPLPTGDDEAEARTRLFEAVTRLVMALAERSPVVLFLDDLHWASRASLDVIRYAGRRWAEEGARVLLVLGLRAEATEALPSPAGWVAELGRTLPARRLMLDPLAAGDTLDLVRALMGTRYGERVPDTLERFGRWLFEETGGHPLFLAETVKVLLERGVLAARPGGGAGIGRSR